jgi:hypothetical protein
MRWRLCYPLKYSMSPRVWAYEPGAVEKAQKNAIDLLEESTDITIMRSTGYQ